VVSRRDELRTGGGPLDDAPLVRYQLHGKVAVLTINRPERHNAWTFEVEKELFDLADRADSYDRVGAIVVTGAGTSFCPGMDMKVLAGLGAGPGVAARLRPATHLAATSGFALAAGPVLGGVLTGLWSWRTRSLTHGASRTSPPAG
jgi:enoyl-CoA hydratase/carnithine racemase